MFCDVQLNNFDNIFSPEVQSSGFAKLLNALTVCTMNWSMFLWEENNKNKRIGHD